MAGEPTTVTSVGKNDKVSVIDVEETPAREMPAPTEVPTEETAPPAEVSAGDAAEKKPDREIRVEKPKLNIDLERKEEAAQLPPLQAAPNIFANSELAKSCAEKSIVVQKVNYTDNALFVEIEAATFEDANSLDSKKLAFECRYNYGWLDAGIEPYAAPALSHDNNGNTIFAQTWKIIPAL